MARLTLTTLSVYLLLLPLALAAPIAYRGPMRQVEANTLRQHDGPLVRARSPHLGFGHQRHLDRVTAALNRFTAAITAVNPAAAAAVAAAMPNTAAAAAVAAAVPNTAAAAAAVPNTATGAAVSNTAAATGAPLTARYTTLEVNPATLVSKVTPDTLSPPRLPVAAKGAQFLRALRLLRAKLASRSPHDNGNDNNAHAWSGPCDDILIRTGAEGSHHGSLKETLY
ncbi:hypothetical protein P8C59_009465 [Phyllachora maydis]|uniref:Uncharacterized protein n=1 Tax=Phyllachora maydis TaxID=1825666 RepID=A0AAD9MGC9_9PEZI|nr:hypothetical protein P8C59_009465 [Phyllachora maydis]